MFPTSMAYGMALGSPTKAHAPSHPREASDHVSPSTEPGRKVLIVEDDAAIRETLKFALELEGYKVFTAANGKEAVDALKNNPAPCLILLDLMMPVMDGWEFVDTMKSDESLPDVPVIVVTAFPDKGRAIRSEGVMKKPVDLDLLTAMVKRWCG